MREIAETVGISEDLVGHILHDILGTRKLSASCVPRWLIPDKLVRATTSEQCLKLFKRDLKEFLGRSVTINEIWIHRYTLETKQRTGETVDCTRSKMVTGSCYADSTPNCEENGDRKVKKRCFSTMTTRQLAHAPKNKIKFYFMGFIYLHAILILLLK